jgi:DNA polymerase III alpha subunit (gram-positive type)
MYIYTCIYIYIIDWANGNIRDTFETLCNPPLTKKLPKVITALTGITDLMLKGICTYMLIYLYLYKLLKYI